MSFLVWFVNYTLALFMWLILGRATLGVLLGARESPLAVVFARLTDPVFRLTRRVLPFVGERWAPLWSLLLLAALRVALILVARPAVGR